MATYLAVPLKKTYEVDFAKPLRSFIQNTYTSAEPDDYNSALSEFNKLRNLMITKSVDKHESALEVLYRYYDQLIAIENKLPITENQIRVLFKWKDAFDEGSLFSGRRTLAIASGAYERVCMLFNIAALQSQIAAVQNNDSDEGLKTAAKYFQQACGIYGHLKDVVMSHVQQDPTPDINPDTVSALSSLMLAQAQEAFYRKATNDKMKDAMIAKLAYQTSELYADAMKLMQLSSIRDLWPRDWLSTVVMKQAAFHGLAEYYQSQVAANGKNYGEQIARLQHAQELLNASQTRGGMTFSFQNDVSRVKRALDAAKKDNDFIYHEKIPEVKNLPQIGKAVIAKPLFPPAPFSKNFTDLFEKLVPLQVHEALVAFENRKAQIANTEIGRLRESTQLMNGVLSSLNLPAAIEDLTGQAVPQSVIEKGEQLQQVGGVDHIVKLMKELPELLSRNRQILDECVRLLDDEEKSDNQLREQFKERWSRTKSDVLTKPMREEAAKYGAILNNAVQADRIVHEKFEKHKNAISILSKPRNEMEKALPSASPGAALQSSPVVQQLRQHMEAVETLKAERDVVETELKESKFDMTSKFMAALAGEGLINEEALSTAELDRVYAPLRMQVSDSIHRQETLMALIQNANTEFCNAKSSNQSAAQRETMLKDLASGFDMFMELKGNLEEGTKFYNDLTPLLVRLQSKISDFCFARKTEKDELMSDLQKQIVNTPAQPPPATPQYQGYGSGWNAPYPQGQGYPMPAMPTGGYSTYNPYMSYPQAPPHQQGGYPYPPQGYHQQQMGYPQQGYPQQGYPQPPYPHNPQYR
ncbi:hypothetical protein LOTGIDRAFT_207048 [Lottia gigantea]|uniref:BRO1 domain-containing protein n=1 Tax=Lottia gigantea TaxID=225164 RepID=V4A0Q2_LOTGI|nr:hypothetical protein LOTGIDRAFT_207048 [Lottia gigantea]ESO86831.1 hypothetical protein LOTGIDRAFT_207048 [Lottia gigantea]